MSRFPREGNLTGKRYGNENQLEIRHRIDSKYYEIHCSKCESDPDLHGKAMYKLSSGDICKGIIPCGCSKSPRWKIWQKKKIVERVIANFKDVELLPCNTDFKKVKLKCNKHNKEFVNTFVVLRTGKGGNCSECMAGIISSKQKLTVENCNKELKEIQPNLTVISNESKHSKVAVICKICSGDSLVEEGLCSGIFYKNFNSMRKGEKPCRCHKQYVYNLPQKIRRIEYMLENSGRKFDLISIYQRDESHGEVTLTADWGRFWCDIHGEFQRNLSRMAQKQQGCPTCDLKFGGFDETKPALFYILGIRGSVQDFIGFGISSQFSKRLTDHKTNLGKSGYHIESIETFAMGGVYARSLENQVKKTFKRISIDVDGFKRESLEFKDYFNLKDFVNKYVDNIK